MKSAVICYLTATEIFLFIAGFLFGLILGYCYGRKDEADDMNLKQKGG